MGDELYPINLLTEEMRTDETETRIRSMRRLRTVAQALGPDRTRSELLPFLSQSTDDEDEVLVAMAEELGEFVDLVGGPNSASVLLGPLEVLATVEETVVRDKAVASIQKVLEVVTDAGELALPLVKRLTEGDWFTSRVSACWLFPVAYTKVDASSKKELRDLYTTLCGDDTPMVRRAAALNIGKFGAKMEKDIFVSTILPLFKVLTGDDQDSVRLLAIENCASIAKLLNEDENTQHVLPVARSSCEDRSWRVRFSIAKDFFPLAEAMGASIAEGELLHHFVQLIQDAEAEVRAAAAKNISGFASLIKFSTFMAEVFPQIQPLSQDVAPNVRTAVSIVCMEIAPKLGEDVTKSSLVPIMLQFLRDDVVDVRLNVLKRMSAVSPWMHSFEGTLLPAITDLSKDLQWRVREAVILALPSLVSSLGATYFQEHLLEMFLNAFQDMVSEVRLSTTKILQEILHVVGSDYILESILPKLAQIYDSSIIYQERVNVFHALTQLACDKTSPDLIGEMTTLSIRGANDKIPNVRFTVTNTLQVLGKHTDNPALTGQIKSCLAHLQTDTDPDVKYFASAALESVSA
ncbi:hypothetical protein SDRG_17095 [Saprolegnia diclina VS20]|uniref:Phosphatase PP2A regulatory subunit A/Splicing factor 3B subunit 1-like HEAT repeat domain-containing protein n=1 Tax=Saprolegnia diclina (strain VS20) TaxID=1156394 RepID=T0QZ45_SAPDV|nr:hypothetical protein SDRG_17095 [Saprolegnia diclina VS20]EQC25018.1 hypothetical protein SDRG_17095 [Saprolegnia diclina VS20]|eukprot:XP_008621552.1 hypothetical protein SDRG_17095 [Saprolegnia diclina VS20]